ncbi:uncharacterized protein PFL1_03610 [Pseudozyma flocculosa PF-1]|uniref:Uncharacterized protein n=2 Tax=Pseudozyma flocculosa TaxID=84751 RepID=A0A5C3F4G6_9BASI|nr:uncharacterized protein PFL1_03610 [Pseudozyma flocculosa PF-1]EPQ28807.1 hypothetical protein PFL1_03610 [Pseudozyma flocculosa PF-1]SPO39404.1 uncharacterized protein PSFLO_04885 [Pseudozyma flocculosa]
MAGTKSKRGSREQAQLAAVSEALAKGTATSSKRKSFDDDGEDGSALQADTSPAKAIPQQGRSEAEDDDDDEEAPVEEVSNKSTKRKLANEATQKKAEQKAAEEKRKKQEQERLQKRQQEAEAAALAAERKQAKKGRGKKTAAAELAEEQPSAGSSQVADDEQDVDRPDDGLESDAFDIEEDDLDADLDEPTDLEDEGEADASSSASTAAAGPSRLDPSLFAKVFAKKTPAAKSILKRKAADPMTAEMEAEERLRRKKLRAKRQGGIVKGRDGMPMRRLPDGTIVRSLSSHAPLGKKKTNFDDDDAAAQAQGEEEEEEEDTTPLDPAVRPTPLDPSVSLPNAKIRGYKKRKLGLSSTRDAAKATATAPATKKKSKKAAGSSDAATIRSEDDPLGLNDPAFLPGGEFYRPKKLTGARPKKGPSHEGAGKPGALARQGYRGRGGRTDALSAISAGQRGGPALGFARSLA